MRTEWASRVERVASTFLVRQAASGEATFWFEVGSVRNISVKDYEDPNQGESALSGVLMLTGTLRIKPKGAVWDAPFPVSSRVQVSQHASSGTTVLQVQGTDPMARLLDMALSDYKVEDAVIKALGRVEFVPYAKALSPTEQAWAWLTDALKHRRLPTSNGQDRVVAPSEFMLMNEEPRGGRWQFKHHDTRNYVFVDAKNGKLIVPQTTEPFMRGQFDKLAARR